MKPMNYQQALASGHEAFWGHIKGRSWVCADLWTVGALENPARDKRIDEICEFLPIPTADQLLGAVEVRIGEIHTDTCFIPSDEVIILRKPNPNDNTAGNDRPV